MKSLSKNDLSELRGVKSARKLNKQINPVRCKYLPLPVKYRVRRANIEFRLTLREQ